MKKIFTALTVIWLGMTGYFLFIYKPATTNKPASSGEMENLQKNAPQNTLETQTNEDGGISMVVTPDISAAGVIKFKMALNNHRVELNYNLVELTRLIDDQGNEYKPTAWEGDPEGGHHRQGTLIFSLPENSWRAFKLSMRDIGGIKERIFSWKTANN